MLDSYLMMIVLTIVIMLMRYAAYLIVDYIMMP